MKNKVICAVAGVLSAVGVGAALIPAAVGAAPAGNGAYVVARVDGHKTHNICTTDDVMVYAQGFGATRSQVVVSLVSVGNGPVFSTTVYLNNGHGVADLGVPGAGSEGKYRLRYQTGSSDHSSNNGSFSATVSDC